MREEALQKRRKEAEELLQWHQRLKEEEMKIAELEQAANSIPLNIPEKPKIITGAQLNRFWKNITGSNDKKFDDRKKFSMSQKDLEQFYHDARKIFREVKDDGAAEKSKRKTSFTDYVSDFEIASSIKTLDNVLDSVSSSFATPVHIDDSTPSDDSSHKTVISDDVKSIVSVDCKTSKIKSSTGKIVGDSDFSSDHTTASDKSVKTESASKVSNDSKTSSDRNIPEFINNNDDNSISRKYSHHSPLTHSSKSHDKASSEIITENTNLTEKKLSNEIKSHISSEIIDSNVQLSENTDTIDKKSDISSDTKKTEPQILSDIKKTLSDASKASSEIILSISDSQNKSKNINKPSQSTISSEVKKCFSDSSRISDIKESLKELSEKVNNSEILSEIRQSLSDHKLNMSYSNISKESINELSQKYSNESKSDTISSLSSHKKSLNDSENLISEIHSSIHKNISYHSKKSASENVDSKSCTDIEENVKSSSEKLDCGEKVEEEILSDTNSQENSLYEIQESIKEILENLNNKQLSGSQISAESKSSITDQKTPSEFKKSSSEKEQISSGSQMLTENQNSSVSDSKISTEIVSKTSSASGNKIPSEISSKTSSKKSCSQSQVLTENKKSISDVKSSIPDVKISSEKSYSNTGKSISEKLNNIDSSESQTVSELDRISDSTYHTTPNISNSISEILDSKMQSVKSVLSDDRIQSGKKAETETISDIATSQSKHIKSEPSSVPEVSEKRSVSECIDTQIENKNKRSIESQLSIADSKSETDINSDIKTSNGDNIVSSENYELPKSETEEIISRQSDDKTIKLSNSFDQKSESKEIVSCAEQNSTFDSNKSDDRTLKTSESYDKYLKTKSVVSESNSILESDVKTPHLTLEISNQIEIYSDDQYSVLDALKTSDQKSRTLSSDILKSAIIKSSNDNETIKTSDTTNQESKTDENVSKINDISSVLESEIQKMDNESDISNQKSETKDCKAIYSNNLLDELKDTEIKSVTSCESIVSEIAEESYVSPDENLESFGIFDINELQNFTFNLEQTGNKDIVNNFKSENSELSTENVSSNNAEEEIAETVSSGEVSELEEKSNSKTSSEDVKINIRLKISDEIASLQVQIKDDEAKLQFEKTISDINEEIVVSDVKKQRNVEVDSKHILKNDNLQTSRDEHFQDGKVSEDISSDHTSVVEDIEFDNSTKNCLQENSGNFKIENSNNRVSKPFEDTSNSFILHEEAKIELESESSITSSKNNISFDAKPIEENVALETSLKEENVIPSGNETIFESTSLDAQSEKMKLKTSDEENDISSFDHTSVSIKTLQDNFEDIKMHTEESNIVRTVEDKIESSSNDEKELNSVEPNCLKKHIEKTVIKQTTKEEEIIKPVDEGFEKQKDIIVQNGNKNHEIMHLKLEFEDDNTKLSKEMSPKETAKSSETDSYNSEFDIDLESNATRSENVTPISSHRVEELDIKEISSGDDSTSSLSSRIEECLDTVKESPDSNRSSNRDDLNIGISHIDVRKRVSEILADTSTHAASRGDKSPRLQDFYVTTYDVMSPSPSSSPEIGSPTGDLDVKDREAFVRKSLYGNEAEELRRKQLEIEQEIKRLEQQQKENVPYCFMREIPNKPPPPYKPPVSMIPTVTTIMPTDVHQIKTYINKAADVIFTAHIDGTLTENLRGNDRQKINSYRFVFDLCKEMALDIYDKSKEEHCGPSWMKPRTRLKPSELCKPTNKQSLEYVMNRKVQQLLGFQVVNRKDNLIVRWSRKKRDHVDEILVLEAQTEEAEWTNYDQDELTVKDNLTNEILDALISETAQVFSKILSKNK